MHSSSFHKCLDRTAQLSVSYMIYISDTEAILRDLAFKMWMEELSFKHTLHHFIFLQVSVLAMPLLLLVKSLFMDHLHLVKDIYLTVCCN